MCNQLVLAVLGLSFIRIGNLNSIAGLGRTGSRQVIILRIARRIRAILIVELDRVIDIDRRPLRLQCHIVSRHGEYAICNRYIIIRDIPSIKGIAGFGRFIRNNLYRAAFILGIVNRIVPATAIQIVDDLITRNILGVKIYVAVGNRVRESNLRASTRFVRIPTVKGIIHPINRLCCGQIGNGSEIAGLRGIVFMIILRSFPYIARFAGIP